MLNLVFTALHVMQTRYSEENSVCLSVRLSITRVDCDKTVERSEKKNGWWGRPHLPEILSQNGRVGAKFEQ